ncbi:SDR family NAD(P)-dependent oxidoreductase [Nocardiopsis sediminis]|uniref:SDR family NAD(P)-dependent oxidoreductase n=1 Tax=Nocardiopsis sediminis TaxID=1778267 RepID=A0ABV8FQB2_9ACTN
MSGSRHTRTALVTGASSGIGAEYARRLAELGFGLVLVARRTELIDDLGLELRQNHGVPVSVLPADLSEPADLERVEERLRADGDDEPPVDLLVNNAGRGDGGPFTRQDPDGIDALLDVNVRAVVRLAHAVLPVQIARRERGLKGPLGVINVSSVVGRFTVNPGGSVYAASKAFVTLWSESVAVEVAPHGVHVTVVLPGYVRTDMSRGAQEGGVPDFAFIPKDQVVRESLRAWAAGRTIVVPSAQYKAAEGLLRTLPRSLFKAVARRFS